MASVKSRPLKRLVWLVYRFVTIMLLSTRCFAGNECTGSRQYCPKVQNSTGDLAFVDNPQLSVVETAVHCFFLTCCTGNRRNVSTTWGQWRPKTKRWCMESDPECYEWNPGYRTTRDSGQSLEFRNAGILSDSGTYLCVATDGHTTLNRTFHVKVVNCNDHATNVTFSTPTDLQASLGETFTQRCEGDFGCHGAVAHSSLAWWSYVDENGRLRNLSEGRHGRYAVREEISEDETRKASILTIEDVNEEDFGRTFVCQLSMKNEPPVGFNFSLTETGHKTKLLTYVPLIAVLGALAVTCVTVATFCRPWVIFRFRSAANLLPKRETGQTFDVMLFSREEAEEEEEEGEDAEVLRAMRRELKKCCYTVYSPPLSGGRLARYDDVEKCVTVIVIICTARLTSEENYLQGFEHLFSNAAGVANMVFVSTRPMSQGEWERLSEDYRRTFTQTPRMCPTLTWPGERRRCASLIKHANFWSQVRRHLPKPCPKGQHSEDSPADPPAAERDPLVGRNSRSPAEEEYQKNDGF
ncbi:uncharacterized protein LOC143275374 [Babylonia areolata]|uniref:uncharacterized protein LOC143275374 n=1 Tax=Babylonia areolata TaxID=304850 RepID=UPI003FD348DD